MSKSEKTTIAIYQRTIARLKSIGRKGQTYDDVINELIETREKPIQRGGLL